MAGQTQMPLVLVTGASGFIAGHCIEQLLEQGYRVRGTVRSLGDERKVGHLRSMRSPSGDGVELVEADLGRDAGWQAAVAGCTYVLHVASPFPNTRPKDEDEIIRPAVDGTLRVLRACAQEGVQRVVMTSSVAAIAYGHSDSSGRVFSEADWSVTERCDPYQKSKTLAEQAAWKFVGELPPERRLELVVINPGFVLGPALSASCNTSDDVVRKLLMREMPGCPRIGFATVDVRDVARAHLLAMTSPKAPGNRYICAGDHVWMQEMAQILAEEFRPLGYRVPTGKVPNWLMWVIARFDGTIKLALDYLDRKEVVTSAKAREDLGWTMRPLRESLFDTAHAMIEHQLVSTPSARKAA